MSEVEIVKAPKNRMGLARSEYSGSASTLCTGCGHDSITNHIISALFNSGIDPYQLAKMSGIGCSSKTPAYFSNRSFAFNSVHGRMPAVATGAKIANLQLKMLGVSGDGDTASIGIGSFVHLVRRNLPLVYIVENNGVYGLTKGQFSATAEVGSKSKSGGTNHFEHIDLCSLALQLGCNFVARSFSGDAKQLVPLIEAALQHPGTAIIDVISPCVTFNNHPGSTKSYDMVKEHSVRLQELGFIHSFDEIRADHEPGTTQEIQMPDGSVLLLRKIAPQELDVSKRSEAINLLQKHSQGPEILTGLFFIQEAENKFVENLNLTSKPLALLTEEECRPSKKSLQEILSEYSY